MSIFSVVSIGIACMLALVSLGGGFYEFLVVDPSWPSRPDIIQPNRGGISRKRFWIPVHTAFELALLVALVMAWSTLEVRYWMLLALASHAVMRIWSFADFIPKALAFEQTNPEAVDQALARAWTRRSRLRLVLDIVTCLAMVSGFATVMRHF